MDVISRDEIRLDATRIEVLMRYRDEWGQEFVKSHIITRPLKEWKRPEGPAKSHGAYVVKPESV